LAAQFIAPQDYKVIVRSFPHHAGSLSSMIHVGAKALDAKPSSGTELPCNHPAPRLVVFELLDHQAPYSFDRLGAALSSPANPTASFENDEEVLCGLPLLEENLLGLGLHCVTVRLGLQCVTVTPLQSGGAGVLRVGRAPPRCRVRRHGREGPVAAPARK